MATANRQLLYGPAAQEHFKDHFNDGLKEIQSIKKYLDIETGRKVDKLRNRLARLVIKASEKVESLAI